MRTQIDEAGAIEREWIGQCACLAPPARRALRAVLLDLACESQAHSQHAWRQRKAPLALYHRAVKTHARRIERALARRAGEGWARCGSAADVAFSSRSGHIARKVRWRTLMTAVPVQEREEVRRMLRALNTTAGRAADVEWKKWRVHQAGRLRVLSVYAGHVMRAVQEAAEKRWWQQPWRMTYAAALPETAPQTTRVVNTNGSDARPRPPHQCRSRTQHGSQSRRGPRARRQGSPWDRRVPHRRTATKPGVSLEHESCIPRSSSVTVTWSVFELSVSVEAGAAAMFGISPSPSSIRSYRDPRRRIHAAGGQVIVTGVVAA